MKGILTLVIGLLVVAIGGSPRPAEADTWGPPKTDTTLASGGGWRVTVVPRPIGGGLAYFSDKVKGVTPAGQPRGAAQTSPIARVERLIGNGTWQLVWQRPLVNDVGPTHALLANGGSSLVMFDNWHSAGFGDDVVAIYGPRGALVRKLSLNDILPDAYVAHLPRTVSSRWWAGEHRLVFGDRFVELQVVQPGSQPHDPTSTVPVLIRLTDGVVVPPSGPQWTAAMRKANAAEAKRIGAWNALRKLRLQPLPAPASRDTTAWRKYMFEVRDRVAGEDDQMGGMVLAAPGQEAGFTNAKRIAAVIEDYEISEELYRTEWIFASADSKRLANVLIAAFRARAGKSMRGARIVFVGSAADGARVLAAARRSHATVKVVDSSRPVPPGKPLPAKPPELWEPPFN